MTRPLLLPDTVSTARFDHLDPISQFFLGGSSAAAADATGISDDDRYGVDVSNAGSGGLALRATSGNGTHQVAVNNTGTSISGGVGVTGASAFSGTASFSSSVAVSGVASFATSVSIGGALVATAGATFGNLTATGNVALGSTNANAHTMVGVWTFGGPGLTTVQMQIDSLNNRVVVRGTTTRFRDATGALVPLFVDHDNNRAIFGSATALTSANDDRVSVIGGALHIATDETGGGDEIAQGWRYGATGSSYSLWLSGGTNPELVFKGDSGAETVRFGDPSAAYQLSVAGDANVTDAVSAERTVLGTGAFLGTEKLRVAGTSSFGGALSVVTGGVTVSAGGIAVNGTSSFAHLVSMAAGLQLSGGDLNVDSGDLVVDGGVTVTGGIGVGGASEFDAAVDIAGDLLLSAGYLNTVQGSDTAFEKAIDTAGVDHLDFDGYIVVKLSGTQKWIGFWDSAP